MSEQLLDRLEAWVTKSGAYDTEVRDSGYKAEGRRLVEEVRAEVQRLTELRDALVESMGTEGGIPMTDRLADALESCGVDAVREVAAVVKDSSTTARRSDAGRVEVPELTDEEELAIVWEFALKDEWPSDGVSEDFMDYVRWGLTIGMRYLASRLSPSPQPATGPVVEVPDVAIPMGTALQRLGARLADLLDDEAFNNIETNYLIPAIRELETAPQPSADVVVVPVEQWDLYELLPTAARRFLDDPKGGDGDESFACDLGRILDDLDALRSSTNHDAQDAGDGIR